MSEEPQEIHAEKRSRRARRVPRNKTQQDAAIGLDESVIIDETNQSIIATTVESEKEEQTNNNQSIIVQQQESQTKSSENVLTTTKLLSIEKIYKIVRSKIESSNTSSDDNDNSKFVLTLTENQIKLRLNIAKERKLASLPEAVVNKICDIFSIAVCYLWKVEEKQNFLLNCFGSSYMLALREILMKFYIPLKDDPMSNQTLRFLVPEEVKDYEKLDKILEEQEKVISAMNTSKTTSEKKESDVDSSLYELIQKHQERYQNRQSKFLTGLANPENFLKDADLFRQQRIKKSEAQRKQRKAMLDRKKLAHSSTIKAESLPDNRFTAGIKVKSKKKKTKK